MAILNTESWKVGFCGIAGFIGYQHSTKSSLEATAKAMAAAMGHRGPDDEGIWSDANHEIIKPLAELPVGSSVPPGMGASRARVTGFIGMKHQFTYLVCHG